MESTITGKVCTICKDFKSYEDYHKHTQSKDGLKTACKICRNRENREKYPKTKERAALHAKTYAEKHPEKIKEKFSNYYYNNHKEQKKRVREYYSKPEVKERVKVYRESRKDIIREQRKIYRKNQSPESMLRDRLRKRFQKVIKRLKKGVEHCHYLDLLGCSIPELKLHLESLFTEGMNWDNHGFYENRWNIDHIIPLSKFNLFDLEEQKKAFHYTNLQPLWAVDNFKKGNRT